MTDLRSSNMHARRSRILDAARRIIHTSGIEALSLRDLAEAADVTVPTLYNLIGSRDDILAAISNDALDELDRRLDALDTGTTGIDRAQAIVEMSADLFCAEPQTYKPVLKAIQLRALTEGSSARDLHVIRRCAALQSTACRQAAREGMLKGKIAPDWLGSHILTLYLGAMQCWEADEFDDARFVREALHGLFVCLLADATGEGERVLRRKIGALEKRAKKAPRARLSA